MITVDASVWIDYFNGQTTPQTDLLDDLLDKGSNELVLLDLVLMEVTRGFRYDRELATAQRILSFIPVMNAGGRALALEAAAHFRALRRVGITVRGAVDLMVGAWCIANDVVLLHSDRDFVGMAEHRGLSIWTGFEG